MGHGGGALLALGERLSDFEDLRLLQMPDFESEFLQGRGDEGQAGDDLGVSVSLQDLGRDSDRLELKGL
jgi:hypothetical protein